MQAPVLQRVGMTKYQLFSLLVTHGCAEVVLPDGRRGYLESIEREDGSGSSFNVLMRLHGHPELPVVVYLRTID